MAEFLGSIEGVPEITHEDNGWSMIAEINEDSVPWFIRIQTYDDEHGVDPKHPLESLIAGKRVRVTLEVLG